MLRKINIILGYSFRNDTFSICVIVIRNFVLTHVFIDSYL